MSLVMFSVEHLKRILPIQILSAKIASIKAVEEVHALTFATTIGKAYIEKFRLLVDKYLDGSGVISDGLIRLA
jgi:hypothetical protein